MNFLNGIAEQYPNSVSLAAGRPPDNFLPASLVPSMLKFGVARESKRASAKIERTWRQFSQYSDTNGLIIPTLKKLMKCSEDLEPHNFAIQITNGIQEALLIECSWASQERGAVIAFDPTYVGIAGAAATAGIPLYAVTRSTNPISAIDEAVTLARHDVSGPILLYVIADYDNPTSVSLTMDERIALLNLAKERSLLILEDTAYRYFNFDTDRLPSLISLDTHGIVIHLVSFSKLLMPGLRMGFSIRACGGPSASHQGMNTNIKSYVSVMTSPIMQAAVSGYLQHVGFDMDSANEERRNYLRDNRDTLDSELSRHFSADTRFNWKKPQGGFFLMLNMPFSMSRDDAITAARDYGVITVPIEMFSPSGAPSNSVRFAFSATSHADLAEGVQRFASYSKFRMHY
jgi:(S)-3,5-dihydroxyphenylglycine transaminase